MSDTENKRKALERDLQSWLDECDKCSGYGDDYYTEEDELVCRCPTCFIKRHIHDMNQRLAELEA